QSLQHRVFRLQAARAARWHRDRLLRRLIMKRLTLAAAVGLAYASAAWGQAPPSGTYQFVSGPGAGTPPFTVTGFSTSLGGSIGLTHLPNCGGLHVHGMFNGFADPNSGGCGHGIISLVQSAIP